MTVENRMNEATFQTLVTRLEHLAARHPRRYLAAVLGMVLLGFSLLGLVMLLTLAPALIALLLALALAVKGGALLLLLLKMGKLLVLLFVPLWYLLKSLWQMLFSRLPSPEGLAVTASDAPPLFACMAELQQTLHSPRIHHVLLTDDLNAAVVRHARFGLLGWSQNYLLLGLPLLQAVSEDEARAILAHELGHLSAQHARLGNVIYRLRTLWAQIDLLAVHWQGWLARGLARLLRWYAPYFNAYTFVLARQHEYVADRLSLALAGQQAAAQALLRVNFAAQFQEEVFWPQLQQLAEALPQPLPDRSARWQQALHAQLDEPLRQRFLQHAQQEKTDYLDTHPAIADRLQALHAQLDWPAAERLTPPLHNAAECWLGDKLPALQQTLDTRWQEAMRPQWEERHRFLCDSRAELQRLQQQDTRTDEDDWEIIRHTRTLMPEVDVLPQVEALLQRQPEHHAARFLRGVLWLGAGNDDGIRELEWVMSRDAGYTLTACQLAWQYFQYSDPVQAAQYRSRWQQRAEYEDRIEQELSDFPPDATLQLADLPAEVLALIGELVRTHAQGIRRAYVLQRVLKTDPALHDYVLLFETHWFTWGNPAPKIIQTLSELPFPRQMFLVHLNGETYKPLRKAVRRLQAVPLYST